MGIFVYFHWKLFYTGLVYILFTLEGTLNCGIRNCYSKDLFSSGLFLRDVVT